MLMFIPLAQSIVAMTNIEVKKELLETMASQDAIGVVQVASDLTHRDLLAPPQTKQETMETMAKYAPGDTIAEARRCRIVCRFGNINLDH